MTEWWQHIPEIIDPLVFTVGSFSLRWYAVFFLLGWVAAFGYLSRQIRRVRAPLGSEALFDIAITVLVSAMIGGRFGYAAFYDPSLLSHPLSLVSPLDATGRWTGIWGMSFHGALIGATVGLFLYARVWKIRFLKLADFLVPAVPVAIFFGRVGNFLNIELVGRVTEKPWGMYFPEVAGLRHPSQLYEAFFEGIFLFFILAVVGKKRMKEGYLSVVFLFSYAVARFVLEFFREPDFGTNLFFAWMTRGQALSIVMMVVSAVVFGFLKKGKGDILVEAKD